MTTKHEINDGRPSMKYTDYLDDELSDLNYAVEYLNLALEEQDQNTFLVALGDVVRANGGFEITAEEAEIGKSALYRMLGENGNPRMDSLLALLHQLGIKLTLSVA